MPIVIHELVVRLSVSNKNAVDIQTNNGFYSEINPNNSELSGSYASLFSREQSKTTIKNQNLWLKNNDR